MVDRTYQSFVKRWEEVTDLPVQTAGPLTFLFKGVSKRLKVMPWPWLIGISVAVSVVLYLVFGSSVAALVSALQKGF